MIMAPHPERNHNARYYSNHLMRDYEGATICDYVSLKNNTKEIYIIPSYIYLEIVLLVVVSHY